LKLYLDTSFLVAALTDEVETAVVLNWLEAQTYNTLIISGWAIAEVSSALSIKLRTGQINFEERTDALLHFASMQDDSLQVVDVKSDHFQIAATMTNRHDVGLKAADSLHLAVSMDNGATLCTLDLRLARASLVFGRATRAP